MMNLLDNLNKTQEELSLMGQSIYGLAEVVDTIEQHIKTGFDVYENNDEFLSDINLMKSVLNDMHKTIYGDNIEL